MVLGAAALSGAGVRDAAARFDPRQGTGWQVALDFRGDAARDWAGLTGWAACHPVQDDRRRVAIVLDDKVISSPQVDPSVGCRSGIASGATRITGAFGAAEARELALLIKGGALPVPVEIVDQRTVGPTLGAAAISLDRAARRGVRGHVLLRAHRRSHGAAPRVRPARAPARRLGPPAHRRLPRRSPGQRRPGLTEGHAGAPGCRTG